MDFTLSHQIQEKLISCAYGSPPLSRQFLPLDAVDEPLIAEIYQKMTARRNTSQPLDQSPQQSLWEWLWERAGSATEIPKPRHDLVGNPNGKQQETRRVIGLLGLCSYEDNAILDLLKDGLTDEYLPFEIKEAGGKKVKTLVSKKKGVFKSFSSWNPRDVNYFYLQQWNVLAPKVITRGQHIDLDDSRIPLPIFDVAHIATTLTSEVYSAQLHAAHSPTSKNHHKVALKFFRGTKGLAPFKKEMQNLAEIHKLNHSHLIQHIATIQQGEMYCVIFDWADGGDLLSFWKRDPNVVQTRGPELFGWCFQQMLGLVEALGSLHEKNCRHGDLKPENILYFKTPVNYHPADGEYGRLVITDFGISKLHKEATEHRKEGTFTKASTKDYEAPEVELDKTERKARSRKYDMWSTGCIFLEFIIWLLYGQQTIDEFRGIRKRETDMAPYYILTNGCAEVNPAVSKWLKSLGEDPQCAQDTRLGNLLSLIKNRLIQVDPENRATAKELLGELRKIL
ncbi:kinase-like protein [Nemania sp. NC0429]|nr:kinase-like protein [Nemania sp. NC0429]